MLTFGGTSSCSLISKTPAGNWYDLMLPAVTVQVMTPAAFASATFLQTPALIGSLQAWYGTRWPVPMVRGRSSAACGAAALAFTTAAAAATRSSGSARRQRTIVQRP